MAQQRLVGQGFLIMEALQTHSNTQHSVGLLWTSYHPDAQITTEQHTTEFERAIPASERPKTHALDPVATGMYRSITTDTSFTFTNSCTYLLVLEGTKIYIKIHTKMLLHVSIRRHHQGARTWA
jgi:hypothetical protein